MPREVLVEYTSGNRKGGQAVVKSAAVAKKMENVKIVAFHPSGERYQESKDTKAAEREAQPAVAAAEDAAKAKAQENKD